MSLALYLVQSILDGNRPFGGTALRTAPIKGLQYRGPPRRIELCNVESADV